jgi:hypothetical protein
MEFGQIHVNPWGMEVTLTGVTMAQLKSHSVTQQLLALLQTNTFLPRELLWHWHDEQSKSWESFLKNVREVIRKRTKPQELCKAFHVHSASCLHAARRLLSSANTLSGFPAGPWILMWDCFELLGAESSVSGQFLFWVGKCPIRHNWWKCLDTKQLDLSWTIASAWIVPSCVVIPLLLWDKIKTKITAELYLHPRNATFSLRLNPQLTNWKKKDPKSINFLFSI